MRKAGFILLLLSVAALVGTMGAQTAAFAQQDEERKPLATDIPKEPGWRDPGYRGWEILSINGMIGTYYDLDRDGTLDYMVIRKILRQVSAEEVSIEDAIKTALFENSSVYVSFPHIYYTSRYPMFYCLGVDPRGNCGQIWVDVQEDGLNGNEVLYTLSIPQIPVR